MNIYKEAGHRIYLIRAMRGYTRECLSERADISPKFLYEIETGRKGFSAVVLYNLCQALEVDCDYILSGKRNMETDRTFLELLRSINKYIQ